MVSKSMSRTPIQWTVEEIVEHTKHTHIEVISKSPHITHARNQRMERMHTIDDPDMNTVHGNTSGFR
jgi:hypothetical protein